MGPRSIERGILLLHLLVAYRHSASMGPRSIERGIAPCVCPPLLPIQSFNGAALN